jgi:site-specific recombinase XerD
LAKTDSALSPADIARNAEGWLLDGEIRQHLAATLANRRLILDKLLWFLHNKPYATCGLLELRQFLAYVGRGNERGGRWGNAQVTRAALPSTVQSYYRHLRTFFRWMISEGILDTSPMEAIATPVDRPDQVRPFTHAHVSSMLAVAKKSQTPRILDLRDCRHTSESRQQAYGG